MAVRTGRVGERRLESVLAITRDILRAPDLDFALESIAAGVADVFGFRFVTIVIAEGNGDRMVRRVMHGFAPETVAERKNEEVSRTEMLALLEKRFESAEKLFLPAGRSRGRLAALDLYRHLAARCRAHVAASVARTRFALHGAARRSRHDDRLYESGCAARRLHSRSR